MKKTVIAVMEKVTITSIALAAAARLVVAAVAAAGREESPPERKRTHGRQAAPARGSSIE